MSPKTLQFQGSPVIPAAGNRNLKRLRVIEDSDSEDEDEEPTTQPVGPESEPVTEAVENGNQESNGKDKGQIHT